MKKTVIAILASLLIFGISALRAEWKPAGDRIKTPWAEKVDPSNVLPEYPRPLMVRQQWTNLNGLWDFAITKQGAGQPDSYNGQILVPFAVESSLSGVMKTVTE
jgi:hypothetical protein